MEYIVPTTYVTDTSDSLYRWIGSFWTSICEDSELLRQMYKANGVLSAQLYQEYVDALNFTNREKVPVYQHKHWLPIRLYLKDKNSSAACGLRISMEPTPVIGPQSNPIFPVNEVYKIGGPAVYANVSAYKLPDNVKSIIAVSNNIDNITALYVHGANFVVQNGSIYFLNGQDPFNNSEFKIEDVTVDNTQTKCVTIYAADTDIDRNYIYYYIGYVLDYKDVSTAEYKRAANALWDVYNSGATIVNLKSVIAAMLDIPCVMESETVKFITDTQVITDKQVYETHDATLLDNIAVGVNLAKGDYLTDPVRLYDNIDVTKLALNNPYIQRLKQDVPALFLPNTFFRAKLEHGIGVSWELVNIVNQGHDSHGNIQYKFHVYGNPSDIDNLWEDIWDYCESYNKPMNELLVPYIHDDVADGIGASAGLISPLEFFVRNSLLANTFIISVTTSDLTAYGKNNFNKLSELRKVIPAHTYMFIIEKVNIDVDNYYLEDDASSDIIQTVAQARTDHAKYGRASVSHLTYNDKITSMKWIPVCSKGV